MNKQDIIDALRGMNVQDEELAGLNMAEMSKMLADITKNQEEEIPHEPECLETVEITRSYSRKRSMPDNRYENEDFFCSRKAEVTEGDDLKAVSAWLAYECKVDVESQMGENKKLTSKKGIPF